MNPGWKAIAVLIATIWGVWSAGEPGGEEPRRPVPADTGTQGDAGSAGPTTGDEASPGDTLAEAGSATAFLLEYPNEPEGYRLIAESRMDHAFTWPQSRPPTGSGAWWQWEEGDADTEILREPGVPGGPAFNRTRFRAGLAPGRAPVNWGGWDGAAVQSGAEHEEIYISKRIRLVGSDWESQRVGTKLGFVGVGSRPGTAHNDLYFFLDGGLRSAFGVRMVQQNVTSRALGQNRASGPVVFPGRWHHWEIRMKLNDPDRPNGVLQWWVDGRLVMEHSDVVYRTAERSHGFLAYKWNPTWGGTGGAPKSRDDFVDISDIRISGRPMR